MSKRKEKKRARWAKRQAAVQAATYTTSQGGQGSELFEWLTGGINSAGVVVNDRTVMSVAAVYACVSLIAGAVSSLPLPIYRRTSDGRERVEHPYTRLLNQEYRADWPAAVAREHHLASLLLKGDAFVKIERGDGRFASDKPVALVPLHTHQIVSVEKVGDRLLYRVTDEEDGKIRPVAQDDMLHFPGLGFDGKRGMTPLRYWLKTAVGIATAADEYTSGFFGNGARPDFALTTEAPREKVDIESIRSQWMELHGGPAKSHKPAVLTGGLDVKPLNLNSDDAELIATRGFQVEEIARIFGVPVHMIGHVEKTSAWGTGVEQLSIGFVKYTLQRHLTKLEQEFNRKLFRGDENGQYFCEFSTAGLERGDIKTRYEAHRIALGRAGEPAWMKVNEVRRLENLPPVEGGDDLYREQETAPTTGD